MTRELPSTEQGRVLLDCAFSNPHRGDLSLVSQVELWHANAKVFDTFGANIEGLNSSIVNSIEQLSQLYDEWHNDWQPVLSPLSYLLGRSSRSSMNLSQTKSQILDLYLSAAKLHLFAHVFRGPAQRTSQSPISLDPRTEYTKFASHAVQSALDHLRFLTSMLASGKSFETLPAYLKIMTAFSSVFLLRISIAKHNTIASEDDRNVFVQTIEQLCEALQKAPNRSVTGDASDSASKLPASKITDALRTAADTMCRSVTDYSQTQSDLSTLGLQERNPNFHDAHGLIDAGNSNLLDTDGPMDFDFNFLDWDNFVWDNVEEQRGQVDLNDQIVSASV